MFKAKWRLLPLWAQLQQPRQRRAGQWGGGGSQWTGLLNPIGDPHLMPDRNNLRTTFSLNRPKLQESYKTFKFALYTEAKVLKQQKYSGSPVLGDCAKINIYSALIFIYFWYKTKKYITKPFCLKLGVHNLFYLCSYDCVTH